jgi:hypothetical protein
MQTKTLNPRPETLIESMRSIGYSFESAIADIIDNSISANSTLIDIIYNKINSTIIILDNGDGMNEDELFEAMRFGSKDPLSVRSSKDLGRFGLGLKSASFSQCRELIVVSKKNGTIKGLAWDLDVIRERGSWEVKILSEEQIESLEKMHLLKSQLNGTYVLWKNFDRIEVTSTDLNTTLEKKLMESRRFLSLVFHKYLSKRIEIRVNNSKLDLLDPFLLSNTTKAQHLKPQVISIKLDDGKKYDIKVATHILPHISNLSGNERKLIGGIDSLNREQGFYIYRNDRLIIWGNWFRYNGQSELFKYGRIEVSIPNNLDDIWNVDIKKASVSIPDRIKKKLYDAVNEATVGSKDLGKKRIRNSIHKEDLIDYWIVNETEKTSSYKINRKIPLVEEIKKIGDTRIGILLENLLRDIENTIPIHGIHYHVANDSYDMLNKEDEILNRLIANLLNIDFVTDDDLFNLVTIFVKTDAYSSLSGKEKKIVEEVKCRKQKMN